MRIISRDPGLALPISAGAGFVHLLPGLLVRLGGTAATQRHEVDSWRESVLWQIPRVNQ